MLETFKFMTILLFILFFLVLLPYSQNISQHLWLTKGWRVGWVVVGVKLWAWVARLAANHFYESAGGQKKPRDFS